MVVGIVVGVSVAGVDGRDCAGCWLVVDYVVVLVFFAGRCTVRCRCWFLVLSVCLLSVVDGMPPRMA
jgi:hypothetical protein